MSTIDNVCKKLSKRAILDMKILIDRSVENKKEHGASLCEYNNKIHLSPNFCIGERCSIKDFKSKCISGKKVGFFHTHPRIIPSRSRLKLEQVVASPSPGDILYSIIYGEDVMCIGGQPDPFRKDKYEIRCYNVKDSFKARFIKRIIDSKTKSKSFKETINKCWKEVKEDVHEIFRDSLRCRETSELPCCKIETKNKNK